MKKLFLLTAIIGFVMCGCKKDKDELDVNQLHGKWKVTHVEIDGSYQSWLLTSTYITFYSDGSYYGSGYFGTGSGTYKVAGKTVITYVGNSEYYRYDVLSLSSNNAELKMYDNDKPSSSIKIRVSKQ